MPMAINRNILSAVGLRNDNKVRMYSMDFNSEVTFNLENIKYDEKDVIYYS